MEDSDSKTEEMSLIQKFAHEFTKSLPFGSSTTNTNIGHNSSSSSHLQSSSSKS